MNILVTGATGFIGRHLVGRLSQCNEHAIFCLIRNPKKEDIIKHFGVKFIYADITDTASLDKILNYKIEAIFHCAAFVEDKNLQLLHKTNVIGTKSICEAGMKFKVRRFVYVSSIAVISGNDEIPLHEDMLYKATNAYGESKIEAEKIVFQFREKGLPAVVIRPPMVYGEDEPHMMKLLLSLLKHRLLPLLSNGGNKFHLVYVENVVELMIFSLYRDDFLKGSFLIADKEVFTTKEVFTIFGKAIGAKTPFNIPSFLNPLLVNLPFLGEKSGFLLKDRVYSIKRILSLGFSPPYSAKEALAKSAKALYYGKH